MSDTLYGAIVAAGIEHDHHESDLYVPDTPEVREILARYPVAEKNATPFTHLVTGKRWIDIPFNYMPFWNKVQAKVEEEER